MDDSAHAVDDTKMDVAMMEGEPEVMDEEMPMAAAPSVALSGSAKMGLKRVDDNTSTKPEDDDIKTVVEYEVKFSSSGVTDGGLVFGAAISIDEDGKGAAGSNGVNEASVHIGGADGTWKLQFGSNDPGIDLVGNVGLADADNISGMTKTVLPLMYKDGTTMKRVILRDKFGTDAGESGPATLETQTRAAGQATGTYALFKADGVTLKDIYDRPLSYIKQKDVSGAIKYSTVERKGTGTSALLHIAIDGKNMPAPPPGRTAMALTGTIDSFSYSLTAGEAGEDTWSAGIKYDPGVFYVSAGADSNDVLAVGAGGTFAGFTGKATYVKQDGEMYYAFSEHKVVKADGADDGLVVLAKAHTVNEMESMGLSVSRAIGSGANVALAYSRLTDKGIKGTFVGTKQWELDFTYDLGGGASFYAGIEQANKSTFKNYHVTVPASVSPPAKGTYSAVVKKSKVTTLEAGITMTF